MPEPLDTLKAPEEKHGTRYDVLFVGEVVPRPFHLYSGEDSWIELDDRFVITYNSGKVTAIYKAHVMVVMRGSFVRKMPAPPARVNGAVSLLGD
jgi:hypothetical protein